jgi:hypothetical protein
MNTSSLREGRPRSLSQRVMTLDCGNLHNNDLIVIRTQSNLYKFLISDARHLRGSLVSEWRKSSYPDVTLVGALVVRGEQLLTLNGKLQTAAQAIFVVQRGSELFHLTTSPVIALGWFTNREA